MSDLLERLRDMAAGQRGERCGDTSIHAVRPLVCGR